MDKNHVYNVCPEENKIQKYLYKVEKLYLVLYKLVTREVLKKAKSPHVNDQNRRTTTLKIDLHCF